MHVVSSLAQDHCARRLPCGLAGNLNAPYLRFQRVALQLKRFCRHLIPSLSWSVQTNVRHDLHRNRLSFSLSVVWIQSKVPSDQLKCFQFVSELKVVRIISLPAEPLRLSCLTS
jgi:hypothetical protein